MFSTVVVVIFGLIAISSAAIFKSVDRAGLSYFPPDVSFQLVIPSGQCTGRIGLEELACVPIEGVVLPPDVLQVAVDDNSGITKLLISERLDLVDVVRTGNCDGSAVITVEKHCPLFKRDKRELKREVKRDASHSRAYIRHLRAIRPILSREY